MNLKDFALSANFTVLMALFVVAVAVTLVRAFRDGDINWGDLLTMVAIEFAGWAVWSQFLMTRIGYFPR